jgi:hypothetical protein
MTVVELDIGSSCEDNPHQPSAGMAGAGEAGLLHVQDYRTASRNR